MTSTKDLVEFCDTRTGQLEIPDFSGAFNGLQIENNGSATKVGAAVDAGLVPFQKAVEAHVDFLIVHHGLFWTPPIPIAGSAYEKTKLCIESNLAVYGSHLPLDCHPEIGNNRLLADKLGLSPEATFLPYEGVDIGLIATCSYNLGALRDRLSDLFPKGFHSMEFGSENPKNIAILTGSGQSAVDQLLSAGTDTLVTGELKQHHFNLAQELGLNLYTCGHYATETFGVDALAQEVAKAFDLPYEFIDMDCPL
jgi:dinuclear metal center YbgI/SA1388 family protein